jgi:lipoprotein-anchoring transpeptidase ErfK/SrfK
MVTVATLLINLATFTLCVQTELNSDLCFPVGIGKPNFRTPTGTFVVQRVIKDPVLISFIDGTNKGKGILGPWAICLGKNPNTNRGDLCIHGTNDEDSIGKDESHGCIRMHNKNITTIAENYLVTEVKIIP